MKYPKLLGFIAAIVLTYIIFSNPNTGSFISNLGELGYAGAFIAGIFYTFGFTSPFSAGFFIDLNPSSIWIAGVLGGLGALAGDMFIFRFVKGSFKEEFERLREEKTIKSMVSKLNSFIIYIIVAILIASPLPDEAGLTILAGITKIKPLTIAVMSIIFNTIGILILLII